jgi:hypothetical protein
MKCVFTTIIAFLLCHFAAFSQKIDIAACKKVLQKQLCSYWGDKGCAYKQKQYFENCILAGDYYSFRKQYDSAYKYYSLGDNFNDHEYAFSLTTHRIIARMAEKAANILLTKKKTSQDSLSAFHHIFSSLFSFTDSKKRSFSKSLFNTVQKIFVFPNGDDKGNVTALLFAVNPLFIADVNLPGIIADSAAKYFTSARKIAIVAGWLDSPVNEYASNLVNRFTTALKTIFINRHNFLAVSAEEADYGVAFKDICSFLNFPFLQINTSE